jgi:hypothetical protein
MKKSNNNKKHSKVSNFFDHFDLFGAPVPSFTFDKKKTVGTSIGFVCTLTVIVTILAYAVFRFAFMVGRMNPNISEFDVKHVFGR